MNQMRFESTSGQAPPASLEAALSQGLAPDGGLYMPVEVPRLDRAAVDDLTRLSWPDQAAKILAPLLGASLEPGKLEALCADALNFPLPVVPITDRIFLLELFHGPSLAFKDVGARVMARLLRATVESSEEPITVLTATSGDTGGAVAQAFHGLKGFRVVVLFPDGQVSPRQERQFSALGGNVHALAVSGDFDDCQRLAKEAFASRDRFPGVRLTSANSINVGRFLPQATYYAASRSWLSEKTRTKILFSVPSGNFGNLGAGLLAKAMGLLPNSSFLAATNENDAVPRFLTSGSYQPRASLRTLSTAMDVGNPSNLHRILHLYAGDLDALRTDLVGRRVTDRETRACIRRVFDATGYVLDPHTAVGYAALEKELEERVDDVGVVLATAHPAKFAEVVEPILGEALDLPDALARWMKRPRRVLAVEPELEDLERAMAGLNK